MKCIIKYTEQSERLIPPILETSITLDEFLSQSSSHFILYANENEDVENNVLKIRQYVIPDVSIVIGPEGGFSMHELELLDIANNCYSFSLGSNVLRTETASQCKVLW